MHLLRKTFITFLASFESFCESVEAPYAAKHHGFLINLPETMLFKIQQADNYHQLHELTYDALKQKVTEISFGAKQSNKTQQ